MGHWLQLTQSGVSGAVMSAAVAVVTWNIHKKVWLTCSLIGELLQSAESMCHCGVTVDSPLAIIMALL